MELSTILAASGLGLASAVNLFGRATDKKVVSAIAKVTLMPLLALLCYLINPNMHLLVFLGLGFGWLGDVFLISVRKPFFLAGLIAFLTGHVLYVVAIAELLAPLSILVPGVIGLLLLSLGKILFTSLKPYISKDMLIPVLFYVLVLISINFVSINLLLQSVTLQSILLVVGSAMFMSSDYILARTIFVKSSKKMQFAVMALYIPAQVLITLSFALTPGV